MKPRIHFVAFYEKKVLTVNVRRCYLVCVARNATERGDNMNMRKLKRKMRDKGMNVDEVAKTIGISGSTLYYKLRCPMKMTIGEAIKLKDVLGITDEEALDIFLI